MKPPRILLFTSEAPHTAAAGAIVLHRLLARHPTTDLLVLTNTPPPAGAGRLGCRYEIVPLAVDRLQRTRFWIWRTALRCFGAPDLIPLGGFLDALRGFQPDIVVALMQDSWFYDLAPRLARRLKVPLVLLVHDVPTGFETIAPFLRARQEARDGSVYRAAQQRLCISPGMVAHFQASFHSPGDVLLPPGSDEPVQQDPSLCRTLKEPDRLNLGYAGGLHYGYGEQLLALLPSLRATGTRLHLFGPTPAGSLTALRDATDVLRFHGYAPTPEEAWRGILRHCDAILQPYLNPAGPHEHQYATHFPSKLADCLASGLPLLITGPHDASGVRWCRERGDIAQFVTDSGETAARAALEQLRDDPERRMHLARQAQAAAAAFDAEPLRAQLHDALARAIATRSAVLP